MKFQFSVVQSKGVAWNDEEEDYSLAVQVQFEDDDEAQSYPTSPQLLDMEQVCHFLFYETQLLFSNTGY